VELVGILCDKFKDFFYMVVKHIVRVSTTRVRRRIFGPER
jgi:hypothetical protein